MPRRASVVTDRVAARVARAPLLVIVALLTVYLVWGSTYLAIRFALEGYPPFFFPGVRFVLAGSILYTLLRARGRSNPTLEEWRNAALIGFLLLVIGNGVVVLAERSIGSALAATAVATVPLWAAVFGGVWGNWPARMQWVGLLIGFAGIVCLNAGGDFAANKGIAALLLLSPIAWAFGSIWSLRLALPRGLMSSACQMMAAGMVFLLVSALRGESWTLLTAPRAMGAVLYLTLAGSLIAFSAYVFLVQNVSAALATSYAFVNPVVALLFGITLGGEHLSGGELLAIGLVLIGVTLIVRYNRRGAL
jgi:drug/metabolite transporter (DMT)-like permease